MSHEVLRVCLGIVDIILRLQEWIKVYTFKCAHTQGHSLLTLEPLTMQLELINQLVCDYE